MIWIGCPYKVIILNIGSFGKHLPVSENAMACSRFVIEIPRTICNSHCRRRALLDQLFRQLVESAVELELSVSFPAGLGTHFHAMLVGSGTEDGFLSLKSMVSLENVGEYKCVQMSDMRCFLSQREYSYVTQDHLNTCIDVEDWTGNVVWLLSWRYARVVAAQILPIPDTISPPWDTYVMACVNLSSEYPTSHDHMEKFFPLSRIIKVGRLKVAQAPFTLLAAAFPLCGIPHVGSVLWGM